VQDTIGALAQLMDAKNVDGEIFNVGSTERVTIDELAQRVLAATRSESEIVYIPYGEVYGQGIEDMLHRQPAIEKVTGAIGWQPTRSLDEILTDVIAHVRTAPVLDESLA
jgi:UDP-glucose 4-epimerase